MKKVLALLIFLATVFGAGIKLDVTVNADTDYTEISEVLPRIELGNN